MEAIQYKGYTIESSISHFGGFEFFPTEQGRDDDYDVVNGDYKYCGNVRHASTLEEAKDEISEKIMTSAPAWQVTTPNRCTKTEDATVTKFDWIVDALQFAIKVNGNLPQIQSI